MIKYSDIKAPLDYNNEWLIDFLSHKLKINSNDITELKIIKKSVDARKKSDVHFVISVAFSTTNNSLIMKKNKLLKSLSAYTAPAPLAVKPAVLPFRPVIVGFGPAGMFAGLYLARCGVRPIILERGYDADTRIKKVEKYWQDGTLDTECNVQFGEGGAGTFSDGKLNSGVNNPVFAAILSEFVKHGAPEEILYLSKPHIGTDKLCDTVKNIRREITELGGEVYFGAKFIDFDVKGNKLSAVRYFKDNREYEIETGALILAAGHSATDVFELMNRRNIALCHKSFSVGVRIEHTAEEINRSMYGKFAGHPALSAADYKLAVHDQYGRGIYSFCMCPGGVVVASANQPETIVTNGMSRFARDAVNSNSALLVSITEQDLDKADILSGVKLQQQIEKAAFKAAGSNYSAPCCTAGDFLSRNLTGKFGNVKPSYRPYVTAVLPDMYLPDFVCSSLRFAIPEFAKKIECFANPEAVLTGPETRSSSPIRIIRNENCQSVSLSGLFPCAEGAGYAGGIITAAADGIKCAEALIKSYAQ